jgi:hypothetical protein
MVYPKLSQSNLFQVLTCYTCSGNMSDCGAMRTSSDTRTRCSSNQNCWVSTSRPHHLPDTQAIFTSVASFNALTKSDTIQRVSRPFPSKSRFPPIPPSTRRITFGLNVNNAMNAMETIDGEPCICIE